MTDDDRAVERGFPELQSIIHACIRAPLARLVDRGCDLPFDIRLVDQEGTAATGQVDEEGEIDLTVKRIPALPFVMEIVDRENLLGEHVEICRPS